MSPKTLIDLRSNKELSFFSINLKSLQISLALTVKISVKLLILIIFKDVFLLYNFSNLNFSETNAIKISSLYNASPFFSEFNSTIKLLFGIIVESIHRYFLLLNLDRYYLNVFQRNN